MTGRTRGVSPGRRVAPVSAMPVRPLAATGLDDSATHHETVFADQGSARLTATLDGEIARDGAGACRSAAAQLRLASETVNSEACVNSRLDPLQAAILRVKLGVLDEWTERRRAVAAAYAEGLADAGLTLPHVPDWAEPAWHLYVVRSPDRDALQARLHAAGVGTLIHYPIPPHMQAAYAGLGLAPDALPLARQLAGEVLSLPMGPHLATESIPEVCGPCRT